jgi:hypothetical protein
MLGKFYLPTRKLRFRKVSISIWTSESTLFYMAERLQWERKSFTAVCLGTHIWGSVWVLVFMYYLKVTEAQENYTLNSKSSSY